MLEDKVNSYKGIHTTYREDWGNLAGELYGIVDRLPNTVAFISNTFRDNPNLLSAPYIHVKPKLQSKLEADITDRFKNDQFNGIFEFAKRKEPNDLGYYMIKNPTDYGLPRNSGFYLIGHASSARKAILVVHGKISKEELGVISQILAKQEPDVSPTTEKGYELPNKIYISLNRKQVRSLPTEEFMLRKELLEKIRDGKKPEYRLRLSERPLLGRELGFMYEEQKRVLGGGKRKFFQWLLKSLHTS